MAGTTQTCLKLAGSLALPMVAFAPLNAKEAPAKTAAVPAGFTPLFDGKTLKGWRGDPTLWSVRDGAITGGSDTPIAANTFLILDKPYGLSLIHI